MSVRASTPKGSKQQADTAARSALKRRALCHLIAVALTAGALNARAATPPAFSPSWFAQKQGQAGAAPQNNGAPGTPGAGSVWTPGNVLLQKNVQQSIANLNNAAQAVANQMAIQKAAAAGGPQNAPAIPDGIAAGGLQIAANAGADPSLWQNANAPVQTTADGKTQVEIKQTSQKAILTWDSFNVGRNTTVYFNQSGGNQTDGGNQWIALNRINDPHASPSTILGRIKAEGTVYLLNRNGFLFGGGSVVNTHSLLATSMDLFSSDVSQSNAFFLNYGIGQTVDSAGLLGPSGATVSFLVDGVAPAGETPKGSVVVEQGASITTGAQGYTLLAAPEIRQGGSIVADEGQVFLASYDRLAYVPPGTSGAGAFSLMPGTGGSTQAESLPWSITNTGLIQARQGSIQWLGSAMTQMGILVASTSLSHPGSIRFDTTAGVDGGIEFGPVSVTTVLPEKDGETTSSSPTSDAAFTTSSVSINTTATVDGGALIEVPSGNVTFNSGAYVDTGAIIDVSGLADVELPMSSLLVTIPRVGQNELADSPLLRNSFLFAQKDVVVDSTQSGTRADGLDWVGSPVLNAAGYVDNVPRSIDQLMTSGGSITFIGQTIVRTGAQLRLEGGYVNYLPGYMSTPRLQGANGQIYNIADADPNVDYVGFAGQYISNHARWGVSETYNNPLLAGSTYWDPGYIRGSDAGQLTFENTPGQVQAPILDGDISAHAYAGREQVRQALAPQGGGLTIQSMDPDVPSIPANSIGYVFQQDNVPVESYEPDFNAQTPWPAGGGDPNDPGNPLYWRTLSTAMLEESGIQRLKLTAAGKVLVKDGTELDLGPGGDIELFSPNIDVEGTLRAASGSITLTGWGGPSSSRVATYGIVLGSHGRLDTSGVWVNDAGRSADNLTGREYIDGGTVSVLSLQNGLSGQDTTGDIVLQAGSIVDVSSGGYVGTDGLLALDGTLPAGKGGSIDIASHVKRSIQSFDGNAPNTLSGGIVLDGSLLGYGFDGGGSLAIEAPQIQIGGDPAPVDGIELLYLAPDFFEGKGFSSYQLTADTDATIAPGTQLTIHPAYRVANVAALLTAPTGFDLDAAGASDYSSIGDVTAFQRYQSRGASAGFSLTAGTYKSWGQSQSGVGGAEYGFDGVTGSLVVGEGASIVTDPGSQVSLNAPTNLTILGQIHAPGGDITLVNTSAEHDDAGRSLWLGAHSLLDVSGTVLLDPLANAVSGTGATSVIPRTGVVLNGGTVSLSSDRDLVAQSGAVVDVSGASGIFDLPAAGRNLGFDNVVYTPTSVWSDAGSIVLDATVGLFFDGSFDAHAGSSQGRGGKLQIDALNPASPQSAKTSAIVLQQSGNLLADGASPGQSTDQDNGSAGGRVLRFAIDRLDGSGIEDLQIGPILSATADNTTRTVVPLLFSGNVNIDLARSFVATATSFDAVAPGTLALPTSGSVSGAGHVTLNAPYVSLTNPSNAATFSSLQGDGTLDVQADFIDLGGRVSLGGFGNANFASTGDIRFTVDEFEYSDGLPVTGWLYSTGNLDFSATRLYPASGYRFLIDADGGTDGQGNTRETTVAFHGNGTTDNSTPLSAGGTLVVAGTHIEQGGTLWVPSGSLVLGIDDPASVSDSLGLGALPLSATQSVHLAPGSVTSVSLGGAVLPYGTTVDGKDWNYDGDPKADSPPITAPPSKQIAISGDDIALDAGATIDLSGGGHLQASEWVPGTGGSRDVLAQSSISYEKSVAGNQVSQYADGRAIYAILPGYNAPVSAHDAALENGAGDGPAVGQAVYLSGVPGLPDGVYTLLPARYATLPGAYRVVQDTSVTDPIVGRSSVAPDGTNVVGGYFVDALTGKRDARSSLFDVQSATTWGQYSEYDLTSADTFFTDQAEHAGSVAPQLGADAGRLTLAASSSLTLDTTLTADAADGGRGSEVDIAGNAIQIVGAGEQARDGYLQISADGLSTLGASSLLIGGKRTDTAAGEQVDVLASSVLLSNDAAHPLQGPEVILVANGNGDGVTLASGSVIRAVGAIDSDLSVPLVIGSAATDTQPAVSGDGALVRVSNGAPVPVTRINVTGIDGPAGTAKGALTIEDGALLDGGLALSLDATGATQVAAGATFLGKAIDVTANQIGIVADTTGVTSDGLVIGPNTLAQFAAADEVTLRSRSSIDFIGDVNLDVSNALTLSAASVHGDGGTVDITADTLTFGNDLGTAAGATSTGTGSLSIHAGELDFAAGSSSLQGFGSFDAHADRGVVATGQGDFDFGALDVNLGAPRITAAIDADMNLHTTGAFNFVREGTTPTTPRSLGGTLSISGGSVDIGADIVAADGDVTLTATTGDLRVEDGAHLDLAGLTKPFNDVGVSLPGGELSLGSLQGNVVVAAGATLDISGDAAGGDAGTLTVAAENGSVQLAGKLAGGASKGFLGGNLVFDTAGAVDLDSLADNLAAGGINDHISIHTRAGDLLLDAGHTLTAHAIDLTADGSDSGRVLVDGVIDASGATGGNINLNGRWGVDVEGGLLTAASAAGERGGDIAIGTSGSGNGFLDPTYGYEEVDAADSGSIHIGASAHIDQSGPGGNGELALRAPLLTNGDVNLVVDPGVDLSRTRDVSVEAYAVWSTADTQQTDPTKYFDGIIDPAGWYGADGQLVPGNWTDLDGNPLDAPTTPEQLADYQTKDVFVPMAANADHTSFYGNAGTDPGTLMGFIEHPGFTFESRFANLPNFQARPGVELRNPDPTINNGDISLLTNWNLGAGLDQASLFYRYNGLAPFITLRAANNVNVDATLTDGFWQYAVVGGAGGVSVPLSGAGDADAAWQTLMDSLVGLGFDPTGVLFGPNDGLSGDPTAIGQYYTLYLQYIGFLNTPEPNGPSTINAAFDTVFAIAFGQNTGPTLPQAPPPVGPTSANDYLAYLDTYAAYFKIVDDNWPLTGNYPSDFVAVAPPPTTLDVIVPKPPIDNSVSPVRSTANPLLFAGATLSGGSSSSYRLVAGADMASSDPLAVQARALLENQSNSAGQVVLDGHTDFTDPDTDRVIHAPNLIRTGTGSIDIAAAGDIRWQDTTAPTAIYAAGAPAEGTDAGQTANIIQPKDNVQLGENNSPELVVTGPVNPDNGGDVTLRAGGDIVGIQNTVDDAAGSATGLAGASTAQYWWQWMQTGNTSSSRSSINFGAFDQGVMSVGGNVEVDAGGDIRQLSVSLPTTWIINTDTNGQRSLRTIGGGDLSVRAGGNILSGTYFVSRGQGTLSAGGNIGADFVRTDTTSGNVDPELNATGTPVSTLLALQDAQVQVKAGGSIDIGGVYNPSYLDSGAVDALIPLGHADGQAYGTNSSISMQAVRGDLTYGSLVSPLSLFASGMSSQISGTTAGDVLPATVNFIAANGDLNLLNSGELFPSATGNLNLLASGSVRFDKPSDQNLFLGWGLIDASASLLPSALDPSALSAEPFNVTLGVLRTTGYLGLSSDSIFSAQYHEDASLHADDDVPVRLYALNGDIVNGTGGGANGVFFVPSKPARIEAGRDIVDLAYLGQHTHASDLSLIQAGRDIRDTSLSLSSNYILANQSFGTNSQVVLPVIVQSGPGTLVVEAGRDIGTLSSQTELYAQDFPFSFQALRTPDNLPLTGIDTVGNVFNPFLPSDGASIQMLYGVGPGIDTAAFIARYVNPSSNTAGTPGLSDDLVGFVENYEAGLAVDTGVAADKVTPTYTVDQAWQLFNTLPPEVQTLFVQKGLFKILAAVGQDFNDPASPFAGKYERGYDALNTLFPASLGYTANGTTGGLNGTDKTVDTGDLDIRSSTIQTQQGGDIGILAPGGQALLGSVLAPPVILDGQGNVLAGPNTMGVLTLRAGDIDIFTDRSVLLAQSRIFTEQGGDLVMWSSNGDINAGKGAKTNTDIPPATYLCNPDAWCQQNPAGQVSGAGIATLQTIPDAPTGEVFLLAPRGTVDAGDAGIRVSGNLVIAAARVANADNIQVKGNAIGVPVVQAVNIGALNAAGAAASAASKVAEDVARKQQADSRDRMPSVISVQVLGAGDTSASIQGNGAQDPYSPVKVLGAGKLSASRMAQLTAEERSRLTD